MTRVLVCGSRHWTDYLRIYNQLASLKADGVEVVIEGEARGADSLGKQAAQRLNIPVLPFPADWDTHGRAAGAIRNQRMLDEGKPDLVVAFWMGNSHGTADMIRRAKQAGVPVTVVEA